ncbi:chromo domain-containing [Trichoderma cornu-damae]|uniref:Chromo domain-containing n=1 Tax=Trichoderma cornu-damae TaxID=654480 RepID=A0A9P8QGF2_9HYPO|nr:chromo domain-containing [Trichoderma cornu-damae]
MPPALSDEETSDYESAHPVRSSRNSISSDADDAPSKGRRNGRATKKEEKTVAYADADIEEDEYEDENEDEDKDEVAGDDNELDEDVYDDRIPRGKARDLTAVL